MRMLDRYCSGLRLRQDRPTWHIPRRFHTAGYCGLLDHAMGDRPGRQIRWCFPHHHRRVPRWSWLSSMGGQQCSRSCCPLRFCCLRGHAWHCRRYPCDLVRNITLLSCRADIRQDIHHHGRTEISDWSHHQLDWSDLRVSSSHLRHPLLQMGEQAARSGQARPPSGWQNRCSDQRPRTQTP